MGGRATPAQTHGDVFLNSTFSLEGNGTSGDGHCDLARAPSSLYPDAEFCLINCKLEGITPNGWNEDKATAGGLNTFVIGNSIAVNFVRLENRVDVSKRASYSLQLTMEQDAETIAKL